LRLTITDAHVVEDIDKASDLIIHTTMKMGLMNSVTK